MGFDKVCEILIKDGVDFERLRRMDFSQQVDLMRTACIVAYGEETEIGEGKKVKVKDLKWNDLEMLAFYLIDKLMCRGEDPEMVRNYQQELITIKKNDGTVSYREIHDLCSTLAHNIYEEIGKPESWSPPDGCGDSCDKNLVKILESESRFVSGIYAGKKTNKDSYVNWMDLAVYFPKFKERADVRILVRYLDELGQKISLNDCLDRTMKKHEGFTYSIEK